MPSRTSTIRPVPGAEFDPEFFQFLRELAKHNDRTWFQANKGRYLAKVQAPSFEFVRAVGPKLGALSRHLLADPSPVGGSVMRIYRDVRFSKDKSPYRTSVGIRFMYDSTGNKDERLPGFFLHLSPDDSWAYAGIWQLEGAGLDAVRKAIMDRSKDWAKVRRALPEIEGESLKRPPAGVDPAHPFVDDLKRKGFSAGLPFTDAEVTRRGFPERFVAACGTLNPLNQFLARALGVKY